jgi:competence protein ComEA
MDAAPPPASQPSPTGSPAWPRSAQLAAALLLGAALALLGVHAWGYQRWGSRPTDLDPGQAPAYRIDLNRADRAELLQLPGVGPSLAERIEAYRRENGGFRSVDELRRVHGVGPATLARLRPWVCVGDADAEPDEDTATAAARRPAAPPADAKKAGPSDAIDINKASAAELRKLPGIGPKLSQAIVDERAKAPFTSVDDLRRVHGIGAKTLDKLRPYVTVGGESVRVASKE